MRNWMNSAPFRTVAVVTLATAFAVAGCATHYGPPQLSAGSSVQDATTQLGVPTARYPRPGGGERLEFARGPYGKHTFMLDFDAQGRLLDSKQVLDEADFNAVRQGETRDQVLFALGRPADVQPLPIEGRKFWSYRYESPFCIWFQVTFDANDRVFDTGYGPDPLCADFNVGV